MWNFGIPYRLKQYIDIIVQPTYTFDTTEEGDYVPLVLDRPMVITAARGGEYSPDSGFEPYDLQKPYLETIFGFIGIQDIKWVICEPTLGAPELCERRKAEALEKARALAERF